MFLKLIIACVNILSISAEVAPVETRSLPEGITIHKAALSWAEAQKDCEERGAVLASPINARAINAMKSAIGNQNTMYFTGIKACYPEPFVSVEGIPLDNMTMATMDMIESVDQCEGACLAMDSYCNIRSVPCCSRLPYMCYDTSIYNMEGASCGPADSGYVYVESEKKCYKPHTKKKSWVQGEQICISEGAHLAVIDNEYEARTIKSLFLPGWDWVLTGLYAKSSDGDWTSIDGQSVQELFNVWRYGSKPLKKDWLCAMFYYQMQLSSNTCDEEFHYICEKSPTV